MSDVTREKIIRAAWEVFEQKGRDGARIQEIADRACVNKAMIYYHFQSKDDLFGTIIQETFAQLFRIFEQIILENQDDPRAFLTRLVHSHILFLAQHPHLPRIMFRELQSQNPQIQKVIAHTVGETGLLKEPEKLLFVIKNAMQEGKIRPIDPLQTVWNIIGMNLVLFMAMPLFKTIWSDEFQDFDALLEKRTAAIIDLVLYGLLPRP